MSILQIQLLGNFQLLYNSESVTALNQARLQSLLAYLVLHRNAPQSRRHLSFLFWPDSSEAQAQSNLRKSLHRLRQALPEATRFLQVDATTVQWQPVGPVVLDVVEFEQSLAAAVRAEQAGDLNKERSALTQAVDLYVGDLLPGCYDDWITPERERLRERFLSAVERLSELLEQQRIYAAAIQAANRLLRSDPLHEETYQRLMRLHVLNGERASALRVYHSAVTVLKRELGVEPNQRLQELYRKLLNLETQPELRSAAPTHLALRATLVGRQPEWQQLLTAWQTASAGHAHCVMIRGEAGIGKTRLAEELVRWASHQGLRAARARAYAAEGTLIYAPVIEWLRSEALQPSQQQLAPSWLSELARLLPEILTPRPEIPRPEPMADSWQRQRLFEALARAVLGGAQPLLLILDDVQWCDAETLTWLHYLLRFEPHAPLLVVGTLRPEAVDRKHPASTLLVNLRQMGRVTEIELGPLSPTETVTLAAQVAERTLACDIATQLYQTSEGNPLFVVELIRTGDWRWASPARPNPLASPSSLPTKVQAVLQARLGPLSSVARDVVQLAATLGRAFTYEVLAQASGSEEETLVRGLDELWQRRILREQGGHAYDFSHDLLREVAYQEISPARRRQLHQQVAQTLERLHAQDLGGVSAQLALHYERAGLLDKAAAWYYQAGERARQVYASQEAIAYLQRGLDLLKLVPETADARQLELALQIALGAAWVPLKGYGSSEVAQAFDRAMALGLEMEATAQLFTALWGVHEVGLYQAEFAKALAPSEQCLHIAQQIGDTSLLLQAYHALWGTHFYFGSLTTALAYARQGIVLYDRRQHQALAVDYGVHDTQVCAHHIAGTSLGLLGYPEQARQQIVDLLELVRELNQPLMLGDAFVHTATFYQCLCEVQSTQAYVQAGLQYCNEREHSVLRAHALLLQGWAMAKAGDCQAGLALMQQGLIDWQTAGQRLFQIYFYVLLAEGYALAGRIDEGLAALAAGQAVAQQCDDLFYRPELYRLQGELLLTQGAAPDEVETCYRQALALAGSRGEKLLELRATVSLARLWQLQGRQVEAHQKLATIYAWFTEGFDTGDLQAAQALLAALA
jgi:DNA-binding SARP family transcriptional activator